MEPEVAAEAWLELQALYPDRELVSGRSLKNSALRSIQWIAGEPRPRLGLPRPAALHHGPHHRLAQLALRPRLHRQAPSWEALNKV